MYCRKCGKYIYGDAMYCEDCEEMDSFFGESKNAEETPSYTYQRPSYNPAPKRTEPVYSAPKGNRREGFGRALASTILSVVAFFISVVAFSLAPFALEDYAYGYLGSGPAFFVATMVVSVIALIFAIPSLVMGAKSIGCFKAACRAGKVKPVATLVLGIVGLSMSIFALIYAGTSMLMCAVLFI